MKTILTSATALAVFWIAAPGEVRAQAQPQPQCAWAGNHWNCGDRAVYPKFYPHGTIVGDRVVGPTPTPPPPTPEEIFGQVTPNGQPH
jgi:hypothetical protein